MRLGAIGSICHVLMVLLGVIGVAGGLITGGEWMWPLAFALSGVLLVFIDLTPPTWTEDDAEVFRYREGLKAIRRIREERKVWEALK